MKSSLYSYEWFEDEREKKKKQIFSFYFRSRRTQFSTRAVSTRTNVDCFFFFFTPFYILCIILCAVFLFRILTSQSTLSIAASQVKVAI